MNINVTDIKAYIGIFVLTFILSGNVFSDEADLKQQCLDDQTDTGIKLCRRAARSIASSEEALNNLGKQLESKMRYESAMVVYDIGSQKFNHSKSLLQSSIRNRAAWRKQKYANGDISSKQTPQLITKTQSLEVDTALDTKVIVKTKAQSISTKTKNTNKVSSSKTKKQSTESKSIAQLPTSKAKSQLSATDDCYRFQHQQALGACLIALEQAPNNAGLHERLGDVLKSMGREKTASKVYQVGLKINNEISRPKQKVITSAKVKKITKYTKVYANHNPKPQQIKSLQNERLTPNVNSIVSQQIELLDRLHKQNILSQDDYELELRSVLSRAESFPTSSNTTLINVSKVDRKNLKTFAVGDYHALIIGNNDYRTPDYPDLLTAINDAKKIGSLLKNKYGFKTQVLLDADRYSIMNAVSILRKSLKPDDKLLVYYAGHGVLDETTGQGYWLPVDAEPENIANWISATDITDALTGINARHALVVADSCFSASLLRSVNQPGLDEQEALLNRLNSKRSRTVLTSGGLEPVQDDGGGIHSVFAKALITILENNDDLLEAGKLFIQLRDKVILNADQTPQYAPIRKAGHDGGDFIFVPTQISRSPSVNQPG